LASPIGLFAFGTTFGPVCADGPAVVDHDRGDGRANRTRRRPANADPVAAHTATETISVPALFIAKSADQALGSTRTSRTREVADLLYGHVMCAGAGH